MKKFISRTYIFLVFFFLYAPIAVLIAFSFNEGKGRVWTGFTLKWYRELFRDEQILNAFINTLVIAFVASVVATILGTVAAIGIHNMKKRARSLIKSGTYLPILNPEIVTGISLMILFTSFRLTPGFLTIILAHITFCVPTVVFSVLPKLTQMNNSIYEAALDLGCNNVQAFRKVVVPEIMPGIVSGFLMAITYSIDDFVISYFTAGPDSQTLPIVIYSITRKPMTPKLNALSTIVFVVVLAILLIVNINSTNSEKKKMKKASRA